MKTKTKVLIAVMSLILVVGVAVTSVWALTAVNMQASFKVSFLKNTNDVYANINMASYISTTSDPVETLDTITLNGFAKNIDTAFKNQIVVTEASQVVSYVFTIENTTTADSDNDLIVEPNLIVDVYDNVDTQLLYSIDGVVYEELSEDSITIAKDATAYLKVECKAITYSNVNETFYAKLDLNFS